MKRIVLRHISGSKAGQIDEYPHAHHSEITIGRDPSAKLVYDANRDDLVGRQHACITRDPAAPDCFNITDLQSRNGTFVNRQRINGTVRLMPGDVVQLGPGGPQFEFDLDPRPAGQVRSTRAAVATYIVLGDNSYEPALEDSLSSRYSQPIGGSGGGTGFAVTGDGFILTARHVGATWLTEYQYPEDAYPGVLWTQVGGKWTLVTNSQTGMPQTFRPPARWVPAQTRQFGRDGMRWAVEGRHDFLNVTFPKNKTPVPGRIARISDRHDVMMLKIEVPQEVAKCELNDNYETIKAGDQITILGYPASSPMVYGPIRSQDVFNRETQYKMIPEPSLTTGNIGRILREKNDKESETSVFGDAYQITATPGSGNSGGPVFDDKGRVIGIYFASNRVGTGQVSFAVPVRYAMELMTTTPK